MKIKGENRGFLASASDQIKLFFIQRTESGAQKTEAGLFRSLSSVLLPQLSVLLPASPKPAPDQLVDRFALSSTGDFRHEDFHHASHFFDGSGPGFQNSFFDHYFQFFD